VLRRACGRHSRVCGPRGPVTDTLCDAEHAAGAQRLQLPASRLLFRAALLPAVPPRSPHGHRAHVPRPSSR